jgi:GTP cyclohydrolase III
MFMLRITNNITTSTKAVVILKINATTTAGMGMSTGTGMSITDSQRIHFNKPASAGFLLRVMV